MEPPEAAPECVCIFCWRPFFASDDDDGDDEKNDNDNDDDDDDDDDDDNGDDDDDETCLRLLETNSVRNVVDIVDGDRAFSISASLLQLQRRDDVLESRILRTHLLHRQNDDIIETRVLYNVHSTARQVQNVQLRLVEISSRDAPENPLS